MIANTYYDKALSNFKSAKLIFVIAKDDEEQLNQIGYHLQQALELAIKHILAVNGEPIQKTHDIDQLITYAKERKIELYLTEYLKEKADVITLWETKTRYVMGFSIEVERIKKTIEELDKYFLILSKKLTY